ncbi:MAG: PhzF family phenazine biosynthesis protein [Haloferacaceae archaeon]
MDTRRVLLVDAFADEPLSGNAAGVVPDAAGLSGATMAALARELAVSETAFVLPVGDDDPEGNGTDTDDGGGADTNDGGGADGAEEDADRRLRYFSPTTEVDLCGHATVAAHAHLLADGAIEPGTHAVATNAGVVDVEVTDEGVVWLDGREPTVETVDLDYERAAEALGLDPAALRDVGADLPAAVASTGLPFLVVPVNFLERLGEADPDDDAIAALADDRGAAGVYAFTFDALDADSTLHARCFAPGLGIPEDPVTGTASGAAGAYLHAVDAFDDPADEFRFEQGHFLDRPGVVRVRVETADGEVRAVRVGGRAVTALDGEATLPADEGDDILVA